jgi:pyruvate carboxylase
MLSGGLGEPMGGWPKDVVRVVLGSSRPKHQKPAPVDLKATREEVAGKTGRSACEDDLYSHLMYPQVFADFAKFQREYSDASVLPTPAFFYGLRPGEEISVSIEEGKVLFIRLISVHPPDKDGRCVIHYELNGMPRETVIVDKTIAPKSKSRPKADTADTLQVGAPIPGMVTALNVTVGSKVSPGEKVATLEAMKMQTTLYAHAEGVVDQILAEVGDAVESGDLLLKLRK